jgi:hypothetical protein
MACRLSRECAVVAILCASCRAGGAVAMGAATAREGGAAGGWCVVVLGCGQLLDASDKAVSSEVRRGPRGARAELLAGAAEGSRRLIILRRPLQQTSA